MKANIEQIQNNRIWMYCLLTLLMVSSCKKEVVSKKIEGKIFATLDAETSGIDFSNILTENDSLNYFTYSYLYMGGGIAVGDINNDGLVDLYFSGNQVENKLYLNKGNLKFEDISAKAGVSGDSRWYTGVTMADVNADGYLDIYCSVSGKFTPRENQLFINNQDGTFTEKAAEYGLDDAGNSVQGTFFDYDKDGDLDVFVANYPPTKFNSPTFVYEMRMKNLKPIESDHLYRNEGGVFTEVSKAAGVHNFGLSLSATVGDLNNDSWPDIYVSNDFSSPDFMYMNNKDGTFREVVKTATAHTSFYGMGVDIADFNDDGHLDIFQVDMDAQNNRRRKANMASMNIDLFWSVVDAGLHYQYMQNSMQVNSGIFTADNPYFTNVSRLSGTSSTDWSWGPLFADFDNDGNKDLFVSNGTRREINNNDYFNKLEEEDIKPEELVTWSERIPTEKIDNFIFRNKGDLDFERANKTWGITYEGFSNGVVYADLDNDGDLEIITNNIDDQATVFENKSSETNGYLQVAFTGTGQNSFGLGGRVYVTTNGHTQMQELTMTRGFQSAVAPVLHFGVADVEIIEEVKVVWPDGKVQRLKDVKSNQKINLDYRYAVAFSDRANATPSRIFETVSDVFPEFKHVENDYDDFGQQVLLPHKMSTLGPNLVIGDVNNDGLDDYFIGGAKDRAGVLFIQDKEGFVKSEQPVFNEDAQSEDMGALFFDADADGDNDLYVASGGYEFESNSELLQDRLYLNDGNGSFSRTKKGVLPEMVTSSSRVYTADFDKDGKMDILSLGRQVPGSYPAPASTHILQNKSTDSRVKFEDFEGDGNDLLKNIGMATSAVITDFNNDGWSDIILVGEWMPIIVLENTKKGFKDVSQNRGLTKDTRGWWWSIQEGDFDQDGDMDYIVGNNGLNYKYKASDSETFDIYMKDFDKNASQDIVLGYYEDGKQYPVRGRECSSQQMPGIKQKFKDYQSFSNATLAEVYSEESLETAVHYRIKSFASVYLENRNGNFVVHELPRAAQVSSINQILIDDFDDDGFLDALIAGNLYASEVETPRNDAGYGLVLKGDGNGSFTSLNAPSTGFFAPGDIKDFDQLQFKGEQFILVVKNNDNLQVVKVVPQ